MQDNELTGLIIKQAIEVHNALGPGLLESAYKECLFYKLIQASLMAERKTNASCV
jgi:GxxExxY protein